MDDDDTIEPQPRRRTDTDGGELTRREQETVAELRLLDPQLAGLYERGALLSRSIEEAGVAYLVAYIGRELSRGVLRCLLEDEGLSVSDQDPQPNEGNRSSIAKALHLPPGDPRVDDWFQLPRLFASWEKYRNEPPRPGDVRAAFERLSSLLYGRIAPYYTTEAELDTLLQVENPTAEHARRLRNLQLRAGQRNFFFGRLSNPAWVEHLAAEGFFRNPPDRRVNADGSWSTSPWPEGYYLAQVAAHAPSAVADVLMAIPSTNNNPVVWDYVAKAASLFPTELVLRVLPHLRGALTMPQSWRFSDSIVDIIAILGEDARDEAFQLATFLLYVVNADDLPEGDGPRYWSRTDWIFLRFGTHDHQALLDRLVSALETLDPERTLRFLLSKLHRVQQLAKDLGRGLGWWPTSIDASRQPDHDDVVSMVVNAAVHVAGRFSDKGQEEASRVMELVDGYDGELFTRIGYLILSQTGHLLRERVDKALSSEEVRVPGFLASEIASLLRKQFRNASPDTRREYVAQLEVGANREITKADLQRWYGREPTAEEIDHHVHQDQVRILTFFRGDVPEELHDLAERLGMLGVTPSHKDQQLAETGSYSEAGVWIGDETSSVSAEELGKWTADEVVTFLSKGTPSDEPGSPIGLQGAFWSYARENPGDAVTVLSRVIEVTTHPIVIEGIVNGLGEAVKAGQEVDWPLALTGVLRVIRHVTSPDLDEDQGLAQWRRAVGRSVLFVGDACARDSIPADLSSTVWDILKAAAAAPLVWATPDPHRASNVDAVFVAVLNDASGDIANATISAALWDYRSRLPGADDPPEEARQTARIAIREHLLPILDGWLLNDGPNAPVPLAVMGQHLPYLQLLVPEWIDAHAADLFEDGFEDPASRPAWIAYISRGRLYDTVFRSTRPWYLQAAERVDRWGTVAGHAGGTREVTQCFAKHLIIAVVRGLLSAEEEDALLETAYRNLLPSDWGHAYWVIFRSWSDSNEPVPETLIERVVRLWEWRISELSESPESTPTIEEAKHLSWLFHTPHIPDADVIRLGQATVRLAQGQIKMYSRWDRMLTLAQVEPDETFTIAESILLAELRAEFTHIPVDDIRPFLTHVLAEGGPETRKRVHRLINKLGEKGFRQLRDLVGST